MDTDRDVKALVASAGFTLREIEYWDGRIKKGEEQVKAWQDKLALMQGARSALLANYSELVSLIKEA